MKAKYTDGTPVREGDSIRYRQQPGGLLPAGDWKYGTAALFPPHQERREQLEAFNRAEGYLALDPDELHLMRDEPIGGYNTETRKAYYHIAGHIIERAGSR